MIDGPDHYTCALVYLTAQATAIRRCYSSTTNACNISGVLVKMATATSERDPSISLQTIDDDDTAQSEHGSRSDLTTSAYPEIPDGGYGWVCVLSLAVTTFWTNGIIFSWGVVQTALLESGLSNTSTLSFVGALSNMLCVALSLFAVRFMRLFGARSTALLGILVVGLGEVGSSFVSSDVNGLFGTSGVLVGCGISLTFMTANLLPRQYFQQKLGLVNGLVRGAGGLGGTILSIVIDSLIKKFGIPWTFRIVGFGILTTGLPAAYFSRELDPVKMVPFVRLSMFRDSTYVCIFLAGAIGVFSLYVPPWVTIRSWRGSTLLALTA